LDDYNNKARRLASELWMTAGNSRRRPGPAGCGAVTT
jgi:hypothetical protein